MLTKIELFEAQRIFERHDETAQDVKVLSAAPTGPCQGPACGGPLKINDVDSTLRVTNSQESPTKYQPEEQYSQWALFRAKIVSIKSNV
jgi:hypothetical protein